MAESGCRPPLPARAIPAAGDVSTATFKASLANLTEGYFASAHDIEIAAAASPTRCRAERSNAARRSIEAWLLALERRHFVELAQTEKTQARIAHTMTTGKPLRN